MPKPREVADYLKQHPEFFADYPDVLAGVDAPAGHEPAVHERVHARQIQALRERQDRQQSRLDLILDTARSNDDLARALHQVAVGLLGDDRAGDAAETPAALVKAQFDIDQVALFLAARRADFAPEVDYGLLCQRVSHLGSVCDDRVSKKLGAALFPGAAAIGSCAFVPIAHDGALAGVMALGAADSERFRPDMGVLILDRLGQLIGAYLAARGAP